VVPRDLDRDILFVDEARGSNDNATTSKAKPFRDGVPAVENSPKLSE